jgi:hypothetical protein
MLIADAHYRRGLAWCWTNHGQEQNNVGDQSMTLSQTTPKARGTPTTFTMDDVVLIERVITAAPVPARPMGATDALISLAPALRKARERGHSLASLVQLCDAQGLHVSERAISRAIAKVVTTKSTRKTAAAGA